MLPVSYMKRKVGDFTHGTLSFTLLGKGRLQFKILVVFTTKA